MRFNIVGLIMLLSISLHAASDFDREQIQHRIRPVGNVRVEASHDNPSLSEDISQQLIVKKDTGQAIYEQHCVVCHGSGVAGAPKFRDAADWSHRLAKQTLASLTATALKGLNAMPAKGTCQECRDEDLKAAIQYMVPQ